MSVPRRGDPLRRRWADVHRRLEVHRLRDLRRRLPDLAEQHRGRVQDLPLAWHRLAARLAAEVTRLRRGEKVLAEPAGGGELTDRGEALRRLSPTVFARPARQHRDGRRHRHWHPQRFDVSHHWSTPRPRHRRSIKIP